MWATRFNGKLNGVIARTGPTGKRCTSPQRPSLPSVKSSRKTLATKPHTLFRCGLECDHCTIHFNSSLAHRLARLGHNQLREPFLLLNQSCGHILQYLATLPARQSAFGSRLATA